MVGSGHTNIAGEMWVATTFLESNFWWYLLEILLSFILANLLCSTLGHLSTRMYIYKNIATLHCGCVVGGGETHHENNHISMWVQCSVGHFCSYWKKMGKILCWPIGMSMVPLCMLLMDTRQLQNVLFWVPVLLKQPESLEFRVSLSFCKEKGLEGYQTVVALFTSWGREQKGGRLHLRMVSHGTISKYCFFSFRS